MRSMSSCKLRECISIVLLLIAPGSDKCLPMTPTGIVWKSLRDGEDRVHVIPFPLIGCPLYMYICLLSYLPADLPASRTITNASKHAGDASVLSPIFIHARP